MTMRNQTGAGDRGAEIRAELMGVWEQARVLASDPPIAKDAIELELFENEALRLGARISDLLVALAVQASSDSEAMRSEARAVIKGLPKPMKSVGLREVEVYFAGGNRIEVAVPYYARKGKRSKRKKKRNEVPYPTLALLGMFEHCTPKAASDIAFTATVAGSLAEAQTMLSNRGVEIDPKKIARVAEHFACRARLVRDLDSCKVLETLEGRNVVVSTDGGRIRIRKNKRGRKTEKGRHRYSTKWREPKLFVIYVVDHAGKKARDVHQYIDATMRGPDAVFALLGNAIRKLGVVDAAKILFVADGAHWIWNRVSRLAKDLAIAEGKLFELVDFYHVVEHLAKVASLQKGWSKQERKRWIAAQRRLLLHGESEKVVSGIEQLCRGQKVKGLKTELGYFIRNRDRMKYAAMKAIGLPNGSGAVESAIRRVVNLRLKGPGIFWLRDSAEDMLLLRSFYKAGRWGTLKHMVFAREAALAA
jgi:hypothetical protein